MSGEERFARKSKQQNGNEKRFCLFAAQKARDENPNCGKPGGGDANERRRNLLELRKLVVKDYAVHNEYTSFN